MIDRRSLVWGQSIVRLYLARQLLSVPEQLLESCALRRRDEPFFQRRDSLRNRIDRARRIFGFLDRPVGGDRWKRLLARLLDGSLSIRVAARR